VLHFVHLIVASVTMELASTEIINSDISELLVIQAILLDDLSTKTSMVLTC